uniref:Uncharacterized protein n=1 Tax=Nelumbo nucifera TaxID=4432 RepID=A0A822Z5P0_NELNU|nr:TPA_asm: hypothetical protein HUJ06_013304 [Nelumbo nucifera]
MHVIGHDLIIMMYLNNTNDYRAAFFNDILEELKSESKSEDILEFEPDLRSCVMFTLDFSLSNAEEQVSHYKRKLKCLEKTRAHLDEQLIMLQLRLTVVGKQTTEMVHQLFRVDTLRNQLQGV